MDELTGSKKNFTLKQMHPSNLINPHDILGEESMYH